MKRCAPGSRVPGWSSTAVSNASSRPAKAPFEKGCGSIAIMNWPTPGGSPAPSKNELASKPKFDAVSAAASTSTISTSCAPLASPIGNRLPCMAASGSVVDAPSRSTAQPSGIDSLHCAATLILPRATLLRLMSITSGGESGRGAANAIGLVPNTDRLPPQGAIACGVLQKHSPISPLSARRSTW